MGDPGRRMACTMQRPLRAWQTPRAFDFRSCQCKSLCDIIHVMSQLKKLALIRM